jgi:hypothetical protein
MATSDSDPVAGVRKYNLIILISLMMKVRAEKCLDEARIRAGQGLLDRLVSEKVVALQTFS